MNRLARALITTSSLIASMLALASPATAATNSPTLTATPGTVVRGQSAMVSARILQGGTSYTFSSDDATFGSAHSTTVTPSATGIYSVAFLLPASDPVTDFTITLTATADSSVLASIDVPVAAPSISLASGQQACPGQPVTVTGKGFVEGGYQLQSSSGTTGAVPVRTSSGAFSSSLTLSDTSTGNVTVTVTPAGGSSPAASVTLPVSAATVALGQFSTPWVGSISGGCFAPGEQVSLSSSGGLSLPAAVTATGVGNIYTQVSNHPDPQLALPITLTATGQTSHQRAVLSTGNLARGVLLPGDVLSGSGYGAALATSTPGYQFEPNTCTAPIWHTVSDGMQVSWSALPVSGTQVGPGGCSLSMQDDGNVVLDGVGGQPIWWSDTHVSGSRLVLGSDGGLRVLSPTGIVLWNSAIVPSRIAIASSRAHSAVYINGLVQQRAPTAQLERGAGRSVYLQRYLAGRWQNVLSRVTDGGGQLAVGFIQNTVYHYRLVLAATSTASGAISASTVR